MRWLIAYVTTALAMVAMDFCWLTATNGFYRQQIGALLLAQPRMGPAVLFYLLYVVGTVTFVVMPGLRGGKAWTTALRGGLFGLIAYATYDLTNLATLKGFPVDLAALDLSWGFIITAVSAMAGWAVTKRLG